MDPIDDILENLAELVVSRRFVEMETDSLEIKPVPSVGTDWKTVQQSVNAFLNTRGGIVIFGIKEEKQPTRHYVVTGWDGRNENNLKDLANKFTDRQGNPIELPRAFPLTQVREMPRGLGRICVMYVDPVAADQRFVFLDGVAFKRHLTQDIRLNPAEIDAQEEFKEAAKYAKELQPVPGLKIDGLDLAKLNAFIFQLNQPVQVETIKPDLESAKPFLARRAFLKDDSVTILGALVCASHPADWLGFRSHVHAYVDVSLDKKSADTLSIDQIVEDKQDFVDNVLQLMEGTYNYLLRNIHVGVSVRDAGKSQPQYPAQLLRETVNNALAHRDYSNDRQTIVTVMPGKHIAIQNPGNFAPQLLLESPEGPFPILRVIPEAKPRNPKLADVLRVFRKWEGRGIGMATLVNLCLQNATDVPYYRLLTNEVRLHVCSGRLLDERMERHFGALDAYIADKLGGSTLTSEQKLVLSYLIKSEWLNSLYLHTILLTPDNNHFTALAGLEHAGLIQKHSSSRANYPVYVVDQVLVRLNHVPELRGVFGPTFDGLKEFQKELLGIVYRFNRYSRTPAVSAKAASYAIWYEKGEPGGVEQFDIHYRRVRNAFNQLDNLGYIKREADGKRGYWLNETYGKPEIK